MLIVQNKIRMGTAWVFWMAMTTNKATKIRMMIVFSFMLNPILLIFFICNQVCEINFLNPPLSLEIEDHENCNNNHDYPNNQIAPAPFKLGYELKIHPINANNKS